MAEDNDMKYLEPLMAVLSGHHRALLGITELLSEVPEIPKDKLRVISDILSNIVANFEDTDAD